MPTVADDPKFSEPNHGPTAFEVELLARAPEAATATWVRIGQLIGAEALTVILNELGGGHVYVPARAGFFRALHQRAEHRRIAHQVRTSKLSLGKTANAEKLSKSMVRKIVRKVGTARPRRVW